MNTVAETFEKTRTLGWTRGAWGNPSKEGMKFCVAGMLGVLQEQFEEIRSGQYHALNDACAQSLEIVAKLIQEQYPDWTDWFLGNQRHIRDQIISNPVRLFSYYSSSGEETIIRTNRSIYDSTYVRAAWDDQVASTDLTKRTVMLDFITTWNDDAVRTEDEVRTLLDKAYVQAVEQDL